MLSNTKWNLVSIKNEQILATQEEVKKPFLQFSDSVKVTGFSGCNNFFGEYKQLNNSLTFGPLGATRKFCNQTADLENQYLKALEEVRSCQINSTDLLLFNENKEVVLQFVQQP